MVFVLALMVRNYMRYTIRSGLAAGSTTLPNMNNQPTSKSTTEAAMRHFDTVFTTFIEMDGFVIERRVGGLTDHGRQVLHLLGFPWQLLDRPRKKWGLTAGGTQD